MAQDKISQAIRTFMEGADEANLEKVEAGMHPDAVQYVLGPQGYMTISRDQYCQMLKAGKLGGETREVEILSIDVTNNIATAKALVSKPAMNFHYFISLMKFEDSWKVMNLVLETIKP